MNKLKAIGAGLALTVATQAQELPKTTIYGMADVGPAYSINNDAYLGNAIFYEAGVSHDFANSKLSANASVKGLTGFKPVAPNLNLDINGTVGLGKKNKIKSGIVINGAEKDIYPYTTFNRSLFSKNGLSISAEVGGYVDGLSNKFKVAPLGKIMAFKQWDNGFYALGGVGVNPAFNYGIAPQKSTLNVLGGVGYGFGKKINKRNTPEATMNK